MHSAYYFKIMTFFYVFYNLALDDSGAMIGTAGETSMHANKNASATRQDIPVGSAALARLIAEVRTSEPRLGANGYNRTYNRHNR